MIERVTNSAPLSSGVGTTHRSTDFGDRPVAITLAPIDSVDISDEARTADQAAHTGRVAQVRAELAAGEYLHPDKLDIALDRMIDAVIGQNP